MLSAKDVSLVYETLLASPGMNDLVKISFNIPRKHVLLLSKIIDLGLTTKTDNGQPGLLNAVDPVIFEEMLGLPGDLLKRAGLTEVNDKLNSLQAK